jgi:hypothetical protein
MPVKERLSYSLVYDGFEKEQKDIDRQMDVAMTVLQYTRQEQLSPEQVQRLLELEQAAEAIMGVKNRDLSTVLNEVQTLGVSPKPLSESERQELNELCEEAGTPVPAR